MSDYKVTDSELTGIANAIRTKGGTSSPLVFPNGFTSAIGAIPTGGGTIQSLSVTQNGTYAPPSGVDGYAPVVVNVQSGGSVIAFVRCVYDIGETVTATDGTHTLTSDSSGEYVFSIPAAGQWTFTSTAGIAKTIAISAYTITDISLNATLLVATTGNILCEATLSKFNPNGNKWDEMQYIGGVPSYSAAEDAVYMPAYASGIYGYYRLSSSTDPFTAYIVFRLASSGSYNRIISSTGARTNSNACMLYGPTTTFSVWANDTDLNFDCTSQYIIGVISGVAGQYSKYARGMAADVNSISELVEKQVYGYGQDITIGRTDTDPNTNNAEPANIYVKYFAVVDEDESEATIRANIANLQNKILAA